MSTHAYRKMARFRVHKESALAAAHAFKAVALEYAQPKRRQLLHHGQRLHLCALTAHGRLVPDAIGKLEFQLTNKRDCRSRDCALSAARHTRKLVKKAQAIVDRVFGQMPTIRFIFVTFTERSVPQGQLADALPQHAAALKRLFATKRVQGSILGHISAIEIAPRRDKCTGQPTFGLHSHHVMAVDPGYFTDQRYMRQVELQRLFQHARRLPYRPITDVRPIKPRRGETHQQAARDSCVEAIKYSIGPSLFEHQSDGSIGVDGHIAAELFFALRRRRLHRIGGIFEQARKALHKQPKQSQSQN